MTKIEEALAEVGKIEAEIQQLEAELQAQVAERHRLTATADFDVNPDSQARIAALNTTIQNLQRAIPKRSYGEDEARPTLQVKLDRAQEHYELMRSQRFNLAENIKRVEEMAEKWGDDLQTVVELSRRLLGIFDRTEYPPAITQRALYAVPIWARKIGEEINFLPTLRARLLEFGDDSDYVPPGPDLRESAFRVNAYRTPQDAALLDMLESEAAENDRLLQIR